MNAEDLAGLGIVLSFFLLLGLEAWRPARAYPGRKLWRVRGTVQLFLIGGLSAVIPLVLPMAWLEQHRLLNGTGLGLVGGTLVGYLCVSFVSYAFHRATHRFDFLWRGFHQLHHAPQRLDMAGATVFHPLDIAGYMVLSTLTTTLVLGLSPEAAAATAFVAQFYAYFQHLNVKTPQWLGYVIQRPEAHFVHHQRDVHGFNYADLPVWDLLFGTFQNPRDFGAQEVGFASPADGRYGAMLLMQNVSADSDRQTSKSGWLAIWPRHWSTAAARSSSAPSAK